MPTVPSDKPKKNGYVYAYGMAIPMPLLPISVFFVLAAIIYSAATKSVDDYVKYAGAGAVFLYGLMLIGAVASWGKPAERGGSVYLIFAGPLVAVMVSAFYYSVGAALLELATWLIRSWTLRLTSVLATAAITILLSSFLFWFRLRFRCFYGLTETMVGLTVAGYKFSTSSPTSALQDPNFYLVILTAGVYLVVRGFDNIHQGLTKEPIDPVAARIFSWCKDFGKPVA